MAPDFATGVKIQPKVKKADTYETSNANDPNATAVEGSNGKVQYFVKVKADGTKERPTTKEVRDFQAGRGPKDEIVGYEKVAKDGTVSPDPVAKGDFEAFQLWQKNKIKADVLEAGKKQDEALGELIPFPGAAKASGEIGRAHV